MEETENHHLKQEVKQFWDTRPCGTQFTQLAWGSKEFFDDVESTRYATQPFMKSLVGFEKYAGKKLLEVGCGLGTDLLQFARGGAVTTGVDLTPNSIKLARKLFAVRSLHGDLLVADAEALPFDDNTFDVVYSFGVLHHTPNTSKAIDEVFRVLAPGGKIIIMLYHKRSLHVLLGVPAFKLFGLFRIRHANSSVDDWIRIYDGAENPLGKGYTKREVREMFTRFRNIRFQLCDPIRRRFSLAVNRLNQRWFSRWLGFYLIIQGEKPRAT